MGGFTAFTVGLQGAQGSHSTCLFGSSDIYFRCIYARAIEFLLLLRLGENP